MFKQIVNKIDTEKLGTVAKIAVGIAVTATILSITKTVVKYMEESVNEQPSIVAPEG